MNNKDLFDLISFEFAQEWRIMLHKSNHQSIKGSYDTTSMISMRKGTQQVGTHVLWLHVILLAWSAWEKEHSGDTCSLATCNIASMIGMQTWNTAEIHALWLHVTPLAWSAYKKELSGDTRSLATCNTTSMIGMQKGTQRMGTHTLWLHVIPLAWSACEKEHSEWGHTLSGYM